MEPMSRVLRQERERRKISLQAVERLTRIPLRDLQLLEGDLRALANPLSLSASLPIYAAFLNIKPGGAMAQFTAELQNLQRAVIAKGTKTFPKGTRFLTENEKLPPAEDKAGGSGRPLPSPQHVPRQRLRLLLGMLILLLTLGVLTFVGHYSGMPGGQRPAEDARSSPEAAVP